MENELTVAQTQAVALLQKKGELEMLKPLIRQIHLFDSYIAGTSHLPDPSLLDGLKEGESLSLRREENKFDSNAILILNTEGQKLGYVPEKDNIIFARLLDAGKCLTAQVKTIEEHRGFRKISIGIYLKDF